MRPLGGGGADIDGCAKFGESLTHLEVLLLLFVFFQVSISAYCLCH